MVLIGGITRHFLVTKTILEEQKSPHNFWEKAISTACHVSNRLFIHKIYNKTMYELLTRHTANFIILSTNDTDHH
jgi:hypothetical protein